VASSQLVAWSPPSENPEPLLTAVLLHPQQKLDRALYQSLLSDRIQSLVDRSPNPDQAARELRRSLYEAGLLADDGRVPTEEAASHLLTSNPSIWARLADRRLLPSTGQDLKISEQREARLEINQDQHDPLNRLRAWLTEIARLP
jgi:hypothetical protein